MNLTFLTLLHELFPIFAHCGLVVALSQDLANEVPCSEVVFTDPLMHFSDDIHDLSVSETSEVRHCE